VCCIRGTPDPVLKAPHPSRFHIFGNTVVVVVVVVVDEGQGGILP